MFASAPGLTAAVLRQSRSDPAWLSRAGVGSRPDGRRRAAPNTPADSGGPTPAGPGGCAGVSAPAGPDTHPFPGPWPFESAAGSPLERGVPLGRAHGRGGSSGDASDFWAALRRGSGGPWEGASAPSPFYLGRPRADPVRSPDPPPRRRGERTTVRKYAGTAGVPSKRPAAGAAAKDNRVRTRGPVTRGCHRYGWPHRLPFGVGSPAVPPLSASRSGGHRRPPWCAACGRRPGPVCGPGPNRPWPCRAWTPAG